jgi:glutamate racemase
MDKPIGIFDSGIGGLTVVKHLMDLLPEEDLVYFGDTARIPYGTRSHEIIKQYALEDALFLQQFDIKILVVACNTASAVAADLLKSVLPIPVMGVIVPGAEKAVEVTRNKKIGIIGTKATVNSHAYDTEIKKLSPRAEIFSQASSMLIPLVEEGWIDDDITRLTIRKYLKSLLASGIDTLILGCTHFPLLRHTIQSEIGDAITIIDSGEETANKVKEMLQELNIKRTGINSARFEFYVSDIPLKFDQIAARFLEKPLQNTHKVNFEAFLRKNSRKISEQTTHLHAIK